MDRCEDHSEDRSPGTILLEPPVEPLSWVVAGGYVLRSRQERKSSPLFSPAPTPPWINKSVISFVEELAAEDVDIRDDCLLPT